jgi:hypothetical protein
MSIAFLFDSQFAAGVDDLSAVSHYVLTSFSRQNPVVTAIPIERSDVNREVNLRTRKATVALLSLVVAQIFRAPFKTG